MVRVTDGFVPLYLLVLYPPLQKGARGGFRGIGCIVNY